MNVFYKIVELAQEAPVMETNTNNSMFLIGAIVIAFLAFAFLGSVTKATEKGISSGFLIVPLIVILFFMVFNYAVKPEYLNSIIQICSSLIIKRRMMFRK